MELFADRFLVEDSDDRVLAMHARHDRDAEVDRLARHPELEAAVLRHPLLGDVELRHDLDARDDRAVKALVDRPHRRLQDAVNPVFHVDGIFLRLDMDVARASLDRAVEGRVDEPDDRARVGRQAVHGQRIIRTVVLAQDLELEALGRLLQHPRGILALLQNRLDRRRGPDRHLERHGEENSELVEHREIRRVGDNDHEGLTIPAVRNESVPKRQVGRYRAEKVVVDVEPREVDEFQPVPFREAPGLRGLGRLFRCIRLGLARIQLRVVGGHGAGGRGFSVHYFRHIQSTASCHQLTVTYGTSHRSPVTSHQLPVASCDSSYASADVRLKSGIYSASSNPAITSPMMTSSAGSTSVTKRPRFVSISSS